MKSLFANKLVWVGLATSATFAVAPPGSAFQNSSESAASAEVVEQAMSFNGAWERNPDDTIEEKAEQGLKITQTFELRPDGTVMVVTHRLENDRLKEPVVIRSVYDLLRDRETH